MAEALNGADSASQLVPGEESGFWSGQNIGLALALSSSVFIGSSFIIKKRGLRVAGSAGLRAGAAGARNSVARTAGAAQPLLPAAAPLWQRPRCAVARPSALAAQGGCLGTLDSQTAAVSPPSNTPHTPGPRPAPTPHPLDRRRGWLRLLAGAHLVGRPADDGAGRGRELRGLCLCAGDPRDATRGAQHHHQARRLGGRGRQEPQSVPLSQPTVGPTDSLWAGGWHGDARRGSSSSSSSSSSCSSCSSGLGASALLSGPAAPRLGPPARADPRSPVPYPPAPSALLADLMLNEKLNVFGWVGCGLCINGSVTIVLHAPAERPLSSVLEVWEMAMQPGAGGAGGGWASLCLLEPRGCIAPEAAW
jgi:hypothetical protein